MNYTEQHPDPSYQQRRENQPKPLLAALPHECKIAIFRALPGLGDFLCAVPALRSLRAAFPQAEIALVGLPASEPLVHRFSNYLDKLWEFPGYPGLPEQPLNVHQFPPFLKQMQQENFDLAVQMHGSGIITNPLTVLLNARITGGFFTPGQYCPDIRGFLPYLLREPEVRRYLRLLEFLGVPAQGEELEFPLWEEDQQELHAIAAARNLTPGNYACIHPGASHPDRCWPPDRFAVVADAIAAYGLTVVLTGSAQEVTLTQAVASRMKAPSLNLAGATNLGALAALLKQAALLICNDTGVSHLAAALCVPSIIIFTRSDPARWAPLNRDRHRIVMQSNPEAAIAQALDLLHQENAYVA